MKPTACLCGVALMVGMAGEARAQSLDRNAPGLVLPAASTGPANREAWTARPRFRAGDPVIEGVLIGGAIAAVGGMIVAPYMLCGGFDDSECTVIVRLAVGLPVIAGGMVAGGLIDKFHVRGPIVWKNAARTALARVGRFAAGGTGVQVTIRFK